MGLILPHTFLGRNKLAYQTDLAQVGRRVGDKKGGDFDKYDVIIIGGGTAGCVLASRLSEDPQTKVLMIEAGASGRSVLLSRIPIGFPLLFKTKHVFRFFTEPQQFAANRTKFWPRGKLLGGCSSINAQMAHYGAPGDFDEWAKITNDLSWSWAEFNKYFRKFETYKADPKYPQVNSSKKGSKGPMRIGYFSYFSRGSETFLKACTKIGINARHDFNTVTGTRGVGRVMTYIDERRQRVSAETAYLTRDVMARPNLTILINSTVTQVLFEKSEDGLRATGVEFTRAEGGARYQAQARKDVVLAAGAIHSPQILMLSGVGPAEELKKHNIDVLCDLAGVGSNLTDHPVVDIYFKDKLNNSIKFLNPRSVGEAIKALGSAVQYFVTKRGAMTSNGGEAAAFIRTDDPKLFPREQYPNQLENSTSAADSPDIEILTTPFAYKDHGSWMFPMHTFSLHTTLLRPLSRGTVRLKSSSPWDHPVIDPRYLTAPEDVEKLLRGVKLIFQIARQEPLASVLDHSNTDAVLDHDQHNKSDDELKIVRDRLETLYHPASTCRMAPLHDGGVVDSTLRVQGVHGLRVCDASIFTTMVSGHTTGAVLATAEKLADIMRLELKEEEKRLTVS
ncbi:alcohol oxidase [Pluteus cervinus]|uniref:Alcohol oxidase n=1 Tax=Pluteus cervinus TaxID=181527 RepID=A0ACD3AY85_9AGAR|nr:alcohol oxidase [Pluteus cervinus]